MQVNLFKLLGVLGTVALLSASCGSGAAPTATKAPEPLATKAISPAATAAPVATATPAARATPVATATPAATRAPTPIAGKPKPAGRVVTAQPDLGLELVVPYKPQSGTDSIHHNAMYDSIVTADEKGNLVGQLAEGYAVSADGLTWTFRWRDGARFHDGSLVTAKDGEYSQRLYTRTGGFSAGNVGLALDSVEAVNDRTLVFRMKRPYPTLPRFLSSNYGLVISRAYHERVGEQEFTKNPVGSGPFKLVSRRIGESWEYEAFDRYWGDGPFIQSLVLRIIPETSTRIAALKTSEVDLITGVGSRTELAEVSRDPKLYTIEIPSGGNTTIGFDAFFWNPNTPWRIKEVRQAANYAINKQAITDTFWGGRAVPIVMHGTSYSWGWDPRLAESLYPYDPAKARQLLLQAGFPNGFAATLALHGHPSIPALADVLQFVATQLTEVGISTKLIPVEYGDKVSRLFQGNSQWDLSANGGGIAEDPRQVAQVYLLSRKFGKNYSYYSDDWMDERVPPLLSESDEEKARKLWFEIAKHGLEEAWSIFMPAPSAYYAANKRLPEWYRTKARSYVHNYQYMKLAP